jgi:hypothetical protein
VKLAFDPEAVKEIKTAALFYEQCRTGLGGDFLAAMENAFYGNKTLSPIMA